MNLDGWNVLVRGSSMTTFDVFLGVFNRRDADHRRGMKAVDAKYGKGAYRQHVAPFNRKGIMSIFKSKPTKYTRLYAKAVAESAWERMNKE